MLKYIFSRLLYMLPVVWLVVSVVFLLIHLVPGDPIQQMLGEGAAATDISAARHAYGLDVPLGKQYVNYWRGILHGDTGKSLRLNQNVGHIIAQAYPETLELTLAALLVALGLSIPAGVRSALRRNRWDDRLLSFVSLLGLSFPNFALGPILILFFAIQLGWLPVSGSGLARTLDLAGDHNGRSTGGDSYPNGADFDAGGARAGLYPHGAREGAAREDRGLPARAAQCHDPHPDGSRPAIRSAVGGSHRHRNDLLVAGHWEADDHRHLKPGLLPGAGLHSDDWPDLRASELSDGFTVLGVQSADSAVGTRPRRS